MAVYAVTSSKTPAAAETRSLWLLDPLVRPGKAVYLDVSHDGSAAALGTLIELYRVTTIGTPAGTAQTPGKLDPDDPAADWAALVNLTTEPTAVGVLATQYVNPFGGLYGIQAVLNRELFAPAAGARLGLRYTTAAGVTSKLAHTVWFEV